MQKPAPIYSTELVFHPERDINYEHFDRSAAHRFEPHPSGFPRVNVWWLADSALLTYWEETKANAVFSGAGLQSKFVKVGSTDYYIAWQNDAVIVAFRGTEPDEWEDTLTDLKMKLVPWHVGKVHRGFKEAIGEVWPTLEADLNTLSAGRTVWFCGHSLGAALATLAADRYPLTRGVCTFGSPRVGDHAFAAAFNAKFAGRALRYVNHHDVVTHVPPPVLGYKHVELRRFIAPDGTISGTPPPLIHFFTELLGPPKHLLEMIKGLQQGTITVAPVFLLEHMPKAYAIWAWNDYDANRS